jgi:hypothetical protein
MFSSITNLVDKEDLLALGKVKTIEELSENKVIKGGFLNIEGFSISECKHHVVGVYNSSDRLTLNLPVRFDPKNVSSFLDKICCEVKQSIKSQINRVLYSFSTLTSDLVNGYCYSATTAFLNVNFCKRVQSIMEGSSTF